MLRRDWFNVEMLSDSGGLNLNTNENGETPLFLAAEGGHTRVV